MCVHYKVQSQLTNMMETSHQHSNRNFSNSNIKMHPTALCLVSGQ